MHPSVWNAIVGDSSSGVSRPGGGGGSVSGESGFGTQQRTRDDDFSSSNFRFSNDEEEFNHQNGPDAAAPLRWTVVLNDHTTLSLCPHGAQRPVRFGERFAYARRAEAALREQIRPQVAALRHGLSELIPPSLMTLMTGQELFDWISGGQVDRDALRRNAKTTEGWKEVVARYHRQQQQLRELERKQREKEKENEREKAQENEKDGDGDSGKEKEKGKRKGEDPAKHFKRLSSGGGRRGSSGAGRGRGSGSAGASIEGPLLPDPEATLRWFWEYVDDLDDDKLKDFVFFVNSTKPGPDFVLKINIQKKKDKRAKSTEPCVDTLPTSQACFSQLHLPLYTSKRKLYEQFNMASGNSDMDLDEHRGGGGGNDDSWP